MGSMEARVKRFGLTEVYKGSNPTVDIVFVHGLDGHPYDTWTTHKKPRVFWPVDLLPSAVGKQNVRVLTYGYNANVAAFSDGTSKDRVHNHGESLVAQLQANRSIREATERPIIFVAHSLGGLIVKRGLVYSESIRHVNTEHLRSVYVSTYAIVFLATPHNGSDKAKMGAALQSIARIFPKKVMDSSGQLLSTLETQSETLQNINRLFMEFQSRYRIYYFHESLPMSLGVTRQFIVEEYSAAPIQDGVERMGIEADHSSICKFEDFDAPGFEAVAEGVQRYSREAPHTVKRRWEEERRGRDEHRRGVIEDLGGHVSPDESDGGKGKGRAETKDQVESMGNSTNSLVNITSPNLRTPVTTNASIEPFQGPEAGPMFITPPGFRPNSLFYGMTRELSEITERLFNQKEREKGSVAVLLSGVSGCGKSHLARQYMYSHREKFLGGIFWVDAKSREARAKCLWDIAQAASLQDGELPKEMKDDMKFVDAVRKWFETRDGWLIVFDGVSFDKEEEIADFRKFVPDRPNCSIIYTSVNSKLARKQRLLNPIAVKVRPLGHEDALRLLFKGLDIDVPSKEQTEKATELVKYLEYQPLAIHAISHRLNATGKPIETYHIESYSTDKRLAEPYLGIMKDLKEYKHLEALNLIFLLSFFGHHIPVAMVQMGKKVLADFSVEIKSSDREGSTRRDLDTTFATLIKYGLIERAFSQYELDQSGMGRSYSLYSDLADSQTQHSKSSSDAPHQIDILKVHAVVQGFFRDELKEVGNYYHWLEIASKVFCLSYHSADKAIRSQRPKGLVKDYREYETHGGRILSHYPTKEHKGTGSLRQAKNQMLDVMKRIKDQIQKRSPTSSQESFRGQVSIFDRTSSMSSGPGTPSNLSRESTFGIEKIPSESPIHEVFGDDVTHIQGFGMPMYEDGYETSGESVSPPPTMTPGLSSDTRRPPDEDADDEDDWQKSPIRVSRPATYLYRQQRKLPNWRDVGDFRPIPGVDVQSAQAQGSMTRPRSDSGKRSTSANSDAEASLAKIHAASPPPARGGFRPVGRSRYLENVQTYASVASGQQLSSRATSPFPVPNPTVKSPTLSRDNSRDTLRSKTGNLTPSPLAAEFIPSRQEHFLADSVPTIEGANYRLTLSPPLGVSPKRSSDPSLSTLPDRYLSGYSLQPTDIAPLPYDENVPITRIRGRQRERGQFITPAVPLAIRRQASNKGPDGYGSEPMSRDRSGQSHQSLQTEPVRYPPRNTSFMGSPPNPQVSPHHSPRRGLIRPIPPAIDSRTAQNMTIGMGEWASQTPISPDAPPMSRGDSGPGFLVDTDGNGRTLVGFTQSKTHLRFGHHEPINIDEARRRATEHQQRIDSWKKEFDQGLHRREQDHRPYPNVNLIPTASDLNSRNLEELMQRRGPPTSDAMPVLARRPTMGRSRTSVDPGQLHGLGLNTS